MAQDLTVRPLSELSARCGQESDNRLAVQALLDYTRSRRPP